MDANEFREIDIRSLLSDMYVGNIQLFTRLLNHLLTHSQSFISRICLIFPVKYFFNRPN